MEPIGMGKRIELRPFCNKRVNFCGRIFIAKRFKPFKKRSFDVLLNPVEIGGITFDHAWVRIPNFCAYLQKSHSLYRKKGFIKKKEELITLAEFRVLAGKADVKAYLDKKGKTKYGIETPDPVRVETQGEYIKAITDAVTEQIAPKEHLSIQAARERFMLSQSFKVLRSLDESVAGLGPEIFLHLYQSCLAKVA